MAKVINTRNTKTIVETLEVAATIGSRMKGLLGRNHLPSGSGLWIKRSGNSIHTFFMKFPIDLAFVDKYQTVRHIASNVKPWRMIIAPLLVSTDCLELPAGTLERTDTKKGDRLDVKN